MLVVLFSCDWFMWLALFGGLLCLIRGGCDD